jgi:hypothetical protein
MSSKTHRWQKLLATAFTAALQRDQRLRVSWLCVLRAQTRNGGSIVPVAADDLPLIERLDALLPDDRRFDAFIARVSLHAPELFAHASRPLPDFWLMEAVLRYQGQKYPDPLKPWGRRGRRKGSYSHDNEKLLKALKNLHALGETPTQPKLMAMMGHHGDPRRVREWLVRLGFASWEEFLTQS